MDCEYHCREYLILGRASKKDLLSLELILDNSFKDDSIMFSQEVHDGPNSFTFLIFCTSPIACQRLAKLCSAIGCFHFKPIRDLNIANRITALKNLQSGLKESIDSIVILIREAVEDFCNFSIYFERLENQAKIFETLGLMRYDANSKFMIAEAWCPKHLMEYLYEISAKFDSKPDSGCALVSVLDSSHLVPPTYLPCHFINEPFQAITNSYNVPSQQELNPALFMAPSFPFLFSVMFGDIGHGLILALVGVMLQGFFGEKPPRHSELFSMLFNARYMILLLGLFSIFSGLIYNELFSRPLALFPSYFSDIYLVGLDPRWHESSNGLIFLNSYKMKQAIVLGFSQSLYGFILGIYNEYTSNDISEIVGVKIPQLVFFLCTFGYLSFLIIIKWATGKDISIINTILDMFFNFGAVYQPELFWGQQYLQRLICLALLFSSFWMISYKPIVLRGTYFSLETSLLVNHLIHIIEFHLSSISNIASYLRLWALSLAHSQLSSVLWEMIIVPSLKNSFIFPLALLLWAALTIGIMVLMEGMSAFLHALRLHWIEFNGKFYRGEGYEFRPLKIV